MTMAAKLQKISAIIEEGIEAGYIVPHTKRETWYQVVFPDRSYEIVPVVEKMSQKHMSLVEGAQSWWESYSWGQLLSRHKPASRI